MISIFEELYWAGHWGVKRILLVVQKSTKKEKTFQDRIFVVFGAIISPDPSWRTLFKIGWRGGTKNFKDGTKQYKPRAKRNLFRTIGIGGWWNDTLFWGAILGAKMRGVNEFLQSFPTGGKRTFRRTSQHIDHWKIFRKNRFAHYFRGKNETNRIPRSIFLENCNKYSVEFIPQRSIELRELDWKPNTVQAFNTHRILVRV